MGVGHTDWDALLGRYGYAAVLVGTFFEGESILLAAAFVAHRGSLALPWVIACAFAGSLVGDQMFFVLGRRYGRRLLVAWPRWQHRVERVMQLLGRWQTLFMLSFRFLYGLRTVSPFCLGMAPIAWRHFATCNLVGAAVWAVALGGIGWGAGELLGHLAADRHGEELAWVAAATLVVSGLAIVLHRRMRRQTGDG